MVTVTAAPHPFHLHAEPVDQGPGEGSHRPTGQPAHHVGIDDFLQPVRDRGVESGLDPLLQALLFVSHGCGVGAKHEHGPTPGVGLDEGGAIGVHGCHKWGRQLVGLQVDVVQKGNEEGGEFSEDCHVAVRDLRCDDLCDLLGGLDQMIVLEAADQSQPAQDAPPLVDALPHAV